MSAEQTPADGTALQDREQARYEIMLGALYRFRLFFAGLVFTVLSFAVQFQVESTVIYIKVMEVAAWTALGGVGMFALRDCGGLASTATEKVVEGLSRKHRQLMWALFVLSLALLAGVRVAARFIE